MAEKQAFPKIIYQQEAHLRVEDFIDILKRSTLGERRPVGDRERMQKMVQKASLIITARHEGTLVGVARSVSDFVYCTYLSDLAVDQKYQRNGIGKELIRQTKTASPQARLILLSAPAAIDYYPAAGFKKHDHCYYLEADLN